HCRACEGRAADDGTVCQFWDQPRDRLRAGASLPCGGSWWPDPALAGAASSWTDDAGGDRRRNRGASAQASPLGSEEAARDPAACGAEDALAGRLDDRRSAAPRGIERAAPAPADGRADDPAVLAGWRAE